MKGSTRGRSIATRAVDVETCRSIAELRARVDASQLELLDETLQSIVEHGMSRPGTTSLAMPVASSSACMPTCGACSSGCRGADR